MRLFNQLVFDQTVIGTTEVVSPPEYNALLGKAYDLVYEIEVEQQSSLTTATLTVRHKHSNSGKTFIGLTDLVTSVSLASLPYTAVKTQTGPLAALGQVGVKLGAATDTARVRIWASGFSR